MDLALFTDGGGKGQQGAVMSALSKEVTAALAVAEGEEPGEGRYSQFDVGVSVHNKTSCQRKNKNSGMSF